MAVPFISGKMDKHFAPNVPASIEPPAAMNAIEMQMNIAEVWSIMLVVNKHMDPKTDNIPPKFLVKSTLFFSISFTEPKEKITKIAIVEA